MTMRRPKGITALAFLHFMSAAFVLGIAVTCLFGRKAMLALSAVFDRLRPPEFPSSNTNWSPIGISFACFLLVILIFLLARGMWQLRSWARNVSIFFCVLDIIRGGLPSALGPFGNLIPDNPLTYLAGRILSFLLLLYLLSPAVRAAFGVTQPLRAWVIPAFAVLTVAAFTYDFRHSGSELNAIRWHMHHGDRVTVNGVSFPVHYWYVPSEDEGQGFEIKDRPGPMRSNDNRSFIAVSAGAGMDEKMDPEQMIDRKVQEYRRTGYPEPRIFQIQVAKQRMSCVDGGIFGHSLNCYGTGPISSIFFAGGDRALVRFNAMMAAAR
jgi:hypothetical protein